MTQNQLHTIAVSLASFAAGVIIATIIRCYLSVPIKILNEVGIEKIVHHTIQEDYVVTTNWYEIVWIKK